MTPDELRGRRYEAGLTQEELARRLGLHAQTISNWERGLQPQGLARLHPTVLKLALAGVLD